MSLSFGEIIRGHAAMRPDIPAIVTEQNIIRYGELPERLEGIARWLDRSGLDRSAPVALTLPNEVDHLLTALALLCMGVPQVNVGSYQTPESARAIIRKTGALTLIAAGPGSADVGISRLVPPFDEIEQSSFAAGPIEFGSFEIDDEALYRTTSGSTGIPKAFGLTAGRLMQAADRMAPDPRELRVLRTSTMEYDSSRIHRITAAIAGLSSMFLDSLSPSRLVPFCEQHEVTEIHMGVLKLEALLRHDWPRPLPSHTAILTGGSRVPGHLRKAAKAITPNLWISYATSEVGVISVSSPEDHDDFPEGVGHPIEGVTVAIVDGNDEPVAPGEIGRAKILKPHLPRGYLDDPQNAANFRDGWFYANDLLSRPVEGGPLVFHGRSDDVMILNGIKVFPTAIEDALVQHPDVAEAVAYGIPSRVHGDIPAAAIVLRPEALERDAKFFVAHCRKLLGVSSPRRVFILESIPRTDTGKPLKRELPR